MRVLFVCSENRLRSPTAAAIFSEYADLEARSAGTNADCRNPVTSELLAWADWVLVMERSHRNKLLKRFRDSLSGKRLAVLGIPDDFDFMDPLLVERLSTQVPALLGLEQQ